MACLGVDTALSKLHLCVKPIALLMNKLVVAYRILTLPAILLEPQREFDVGGLNNTTVVLCPSA